MIKHYLSISLRNIRKYKAQTIISICAMAVSMTLMAVLTSFVTQLMQDIPMLDTPYADRIGQLQHQSTNDMPDANRIVKPLRGGIYISNDDVNLVLGHQFKSADAIHYSSGGRYVAMATANPGTSSERAMLTDSGQADGDYFSFTAMKSAVTNSTASSFSPDEVVITQRLADKLFDKGMNPIGAPINLHIYSYGESEFDKNYTVKDVLKDPGKTGHYFNDEIDIFFYDSSTPARSFYFVFFLLRDGYSFDDLNKELEAISNNRLWVTSAKSLYGPTLTESRSIKHGIVAFLFLFVCVSFSSYLRQECQLFRLREREVAIRTCCGGKPANLFVLFFTEVLIVLLLTLALSIALDYLCDVIIEQCFGVYVNELNWTVSGTVLTSTLATAALVAISAVAVALVVRNIRRDQTGLAMRMKPTPKHRLRNVGITLQLTISLVFTWLIVILFTSVNTIKEANNLPDDMTDYQRQWLVRFNGATKAQSNEVYDLIERLEPIDHIYRFYGYSTSYKAEGDDSEEIRVMMYFQDNDDFVEMQRMSIDEQSGFNPDYCVLVSEGFKKYLIDNGEWNGKTVKIQGKDYTLRGTYDEVPHDMIRTSRSVIINDANDDMRGAYDRVVVAKKGREKEALSAIDDVLHKVFPSRVDVGTVLYFQDMKQKYEVMTSMFTIVYIIAIVSIVTTVSTIYASVSLDTRRRRKEMALRKLNGASSKVIAKLFLRTYVITLIVAMLISFPLGLLVNSTGAFEVNGIGHTFGSLLGTFAVALVIIVAITALTIAWKIRQIMRVDPIEYLKE